MPKDPVCGMLVDEKSPPESSIYEGKTFYFCSKSCKEKFEQEPKKYQK